MLGLQASIGALNDLLDAGIDSGRKPGKPIPRGAARPVDAAWLAALGLATGLGLSVPSGAATVSVALAGAALGYLYDLRLSRTSWSWLPLAAALPLLPIYAWLGTTGEAPPGLLALLPVGLVAGAGLAVGNGLVDLERDRAAGLATAAVRLGRSAAWRAQAVALGAAVATAWWLAPRPSGPDALGPWAAALAAGSLSVLGGVGVVASASPGLRERGWELEAIGVAILGIAWVSGIAT